MKSENKIQSEIVMWFHNNYCLDIHDPQHVIFSVPNEGQNAKEQMYKKALGLLSGVSDLIVLLNGKILFIECKDQHGKQRDSQINFQKRIEKLGFEYHIVRSLEDFKKIISQKLV